MRLLLTVLLVWVAAELLSAAGAVFIGRWRTRRQWDKAALRAFERRVLGE